MKVPEITIIFWITKLSTTAFGEAFSELPGPSALPPGIGSRYPPRMVTAFSPGPALSAWSRG